MRNRRLDRALMTLSAIAILVAVPLTMPWAFHLGGRFTPTLTWCGTGKLLTKNGIEYPLSVCFLPSRQVFGLTRQDGVLRYNGAVRGSGCLCRSPGTFETLDMGGTILSSWWSTDGRQMEIGFGENTALSAGQGAGGSFDLFGEWRGPDLVMSGRGSHTSTFRSGLRIDPASVTLRGSGLSTSFCKTVCASTADYAAR